MNKESKGSDSDTEVRYALGAVHLVHGVPGATGKIFPLRPEPMSIGRGRECHVRIPVSSVSRQHAELVWEGADLVLFHRSGTNTTRLNGLRIVHRHRVRDGDILQLAEQVVLRIAIDAAPEHYAMPPPGATAATSPSPVVDEEMARVEVRSFLDVDVVDSFGLKAEGARPDDIVASFEAFRRYVRTTVTRFRGDVLNSNGDEVMCCFGAALDAMRAASAMLDRLAKFNESENRLGAPFRIRIGVHTGVAPLDLERGTAYSQTLDIAGHLQKHAAVNTVLVSEATVRALPSGFPFQPAGKLLKEGIRIYRPVASFA